MRKWKGSQLNGFLLAAVGLTIILVFAEPISAWLTKWAFIKILDALSKLGVLVAVITFVAEIPKRAEQQATARKRARYEAWQIVNANEGKKSDGGRLDALQDLNQGKASLAGINLDNAFLSRIDFRNATLRLASFDAAFLDGANLSGADLRGAKFTGGAFLYGTNLSKADLHSAILSGAFFDGETAFKDADLSFTDLRKASFWKTNLENSDLSNADLRGSILLDARLAGTNLRNAKLEKVVYTKGTLFPPDFDPVNNHMYLIAPGIDLSGADLSDVNLLIAPLEGSSLAGANLSNADLDRADLRDADIKNARFLNTRNLTVDQIKSAKNWKSAIFDDEFREQLGLHP